MSHRRPGPVVPDCGFEQISPGPVVGRSSAPAAPCLKGFAMYGFTSTLEGVPFPEALARTLEALRVEGFGVLSDIDVQAAMKLKLGAEMSPYRILGACNPRLAHQALTAAADIGLLLPCNVVVREDTAGRVVVGFLDPRIMVGLVGDPAVASVSAEAYERLERVCASLGGIRGDV